MGKEEDNVVEILANLGRERADICIEKLPEWLQYRRYELLFDAQIKALKSCGLEEEISSQLSKRKEEVVGKAIKMKIPNGNYPFFPNVGKSIDWLARRTIFNNSSAFVNFDPEDVVNVANVPKLSYTLNINDGYDFSLLSSDTIKEEMEKKNFLVLSELLTIRIISRHLGDEVFRWPCLEMAALGSRVGEGYPDIYQDIEEREFCIDYFLPAEARSFPYCEARI